MHVSTRATKKKQLSGTAGDVVLSSSSRVAVATTLADTCARIFVFEHAPAYWVCSSRAAEKLSHVPFAYNFPAAGTMAFI